MGSLGDAQLVHAGLVEEFCLQSGVHGVIVQLSWSEKMLQTGPFQGGNPREFLREEVVQNQVQVFANYLKGVVRGAIGGYFEEVLPVAACVAVEVAARVTRLVHVPLHDAA